MIDPDQNPAAANHYGVRLYNVALLISGGRRLEVPTTDDRGIALALLRITRADAKTVRFISDHGEYSIDNFEFHTHFEGGDSGLGLEAADHVVLEVAKPWPWTA